MSIIETWKRADAGTRERYRRAVATVKRWRRAITGTTIRTIVWWLQWVVFVLAVSVFVAMFQYVLDVFLTRLFSVTFIWTAVCVVSGAIAWWYYLVLVLPMRRRAHEQSNPTKGVSQ